MKTSSSPPPKEAGLRIALIVAGFPSNAKPWKGTFYKRAAEGILRQQIDVTVFQMKTWKPGRPFIRKETYDHIPLVKFSVPQIPFPGGFKRAISVQVNLILMREIGWMLLKSWLTEYDLIHAISVFPLGVACSTWAQKAQKPYVAEIIGSDLNVGLVKHSNTPGVRGWEKQLHGVSCNSGELARIFSEIYPLQTNVQTIHRGIDLQEYRPDGPKAGPQANLPPVRFLFLGGFPPYPSSPFGSNVKGGRTLQAAWHAGEKRLKALNASLAIAGPNSQTQEIMDWRASLRFPEQVHILGPLPSPQIPGYMRAADVILVPSMQEGLPNVCTEAGACGRVVFGSDIGGIPEVLVHGKTGILLPAGDEVAWQDALIEYANNAQLLHEMGENARAHIQEHFDFRQYGQETSEFYKKILTTTT